MCQHLESLVEFVFPWTIYLTNHESVNDDACAFMPDGHSCEPKWSKNKSIFFGVVVVVFLTSGLRLCEKEYVI